MADWSDLAEELAAWRASDQTPTMWLRDDDVTSPGPALDRVLNLSGRFGAPLHLAVIPHGVSPALANRLHSERHVSTLQHGFAHVNHEPKGAPASEMGDGRPLAVQIKEVQKGWRLLSAAGLPRLLPAFVPPWNHISDAARSKLPLLGYRLLSTCCARKCACPVPGLLQVNIHVDPLRWKTGATFRGTSPTLMAVIEHLAARRTGAVDATEPTGILTHHAQADAATWEFLETLFAQLEGRIRWIALQEVIGHG